MRRLWPFAKRNTLEIVRDPLSILFGAGLPIVLLFLLTAIEKNIPEALFEINSLAPGVCMFSLSFVTLFSAMLIAKDRSGMLLNRLYTTPLTAKHFIAGYMLPLIPLGIVQTIVCITASAILGLRLTGGVFMMIVCALPGILLYVSLGLLFGSILTDKQVGGICGALLTNVSAWLSGIWFDVELVGGVFSKIARALPFLHAVELERCALAGNTEGIFLHLWVVAAYAAVITVLAVFAFLKQMRK